MEAELVEIVKSLIETGGTTTLWALAIVYGVSLLKSAMGLAGVAIVASMLGRSIVAATRIAKETER